MCLFCALTVPYLSIFLFYPVLLHQNHAFLRRANLCIRTVLRLCTPVAFARPESEWLTDWLSAWLTDWMIVWLTACLTEWLTDWLPACLPACLTNFQTNWQPDWQTDDWQTDWLTVCLSVELHVADWLSEWLLAWLKWFWINSTQLITPRFILQYSKHVTSRCSTAQVA